MLVSNLIRLGALATMVSGVLLLAAIFGGYLGGVLLVIAVLLVPVGMVGFHLLQRHAYGRMGRAAFWLVGLACVLTALVAKDA